MNEAISAEVKAAETRERRFGQIEADVRVLTTEFQGHVRSVEEYQIRQEKRYEELLATMRETLTAANKTNGSVAECVLKIATLESAQSGHQADVDELSGGLQAVQQVAASKASKADVAALDARVTDLAGTDHDGKLTTKARWETLGWQWKVLVALILVSGGIVALAANLVTLTHLAK